MAAGSVLLNDRAPRRDRCIWIEGTRGSSGSSGSSGASKHEGSGVRRSKYMRKQRQRHKVLDKLQQTRVQTLAVEAEAAQRVTTSLTADRDALAALVNSNE